MPQTETAFANPDHALIHRFLRCPERAMAIDSNPMAMALAAQLLSVDLEAGRVELAFEPDRIFTQGAGVLQGGAVAGMLDFAMAFATMACLPVGKGCATVNLNTVFLRPARTGRYLAVGEVERQGRALVFTHARLTGADDGIVIATATSTLAVL